MIKNEKLWNGRFSTKTDPKVDAFTASISFDSELAYEDIMGSLAHAKMLEKCGILQVEECTKIVHGLRNIAKKVLNKELELKVEDEDIHMNIERLLQNEVGELAGKLHTARSRNDQVALDVHLYLRNAIITIVESLCNLQITLLQLAKQHRYIILPGYTHLQRAQPIFLAQYWLAYASMLQRDIERLTDCWKHVNQCPLGAAALAGSSFAIDRNYVTNVLKFDKAYSNSIDAVSDRDFVVEFLAASSIIMMHISRFSEEMILWSSQEFGFISIEDSFTTGSSIMPQKKNPDVAELSRGKTGRVYGSLLALLTILKGLPLAYNKDLQEDKEPLFDTIKTVRNTLNIYNAMLLHVKIDPDKMLAATENGFLNATSLAEYLVKKGLPFRSAHEVVGKLVNYCINHHLKLEDLPMKTFLNFSSLIENDVYKILDIKRVVSNQDLGNQKAVSLTDNGIEVHEQSIVDTQNWLAEKSNLQIEVEKALFL